VTAAPLLAQATDAAPPTAIAWAVEHTARHFRPKPSLGDGVLALFFADWDGAILEILGLSEDPLSNTWKQSEWPAVRPPHRSPPSPRSLAAEDAPPPTAPASGAEAPRSLRDAELG
jgi:hypothetical protein